MTLENTGRDVESLQGVRDRSLAEQYTVHDLGQEYLRQSLHEAGFNTEVIGDDDRNSEDVQFSDGTPDVGVKRDDDVIAGIDVKTKRYRDGDGEQWFRKVNQRHWNNYLLWKDREDTSVYLWFCLIEEDENLIHRHGFIPVEDHDQVVNVLPPIKGNHVVELRETDLRSLQWIAYQLRQ